MQCECFGNRVYGQNRLLYNKLGIHINLSLENKQ